MKSVPRWPRLVIAGILGAITLELTAAENPAALVPAAAPRTLVLAGRVDAFLAYVTTGTGKVGFEKIRADFDKDYLGLAFPPEPLTYGNPEPSERDSAKANRWRAAQDTCGLVAGVANAGALLWLGTGDERYLAKAKEFILKACDWSLDPSGWKKGPSVGATSILYNDEAHFRLWRKLPLAYDLLRDRFTPAELALIVAHFRARGVQSAAWVREGRVEKGPPQLPGGQTRLPPHPLHGHDRPRGARPLGRPAGRVTRLVAPRL